MNFFVELKEKRNEYILKFLKEMGKNAHEFSFENTVETTTVDDVVIFSPARRLAEDETKKLSENITVVSGNQSEEVKNIFKQKNISYLNITDDKNFVHENAQLTAEAILSLAINANDKSVFENKILVIGFGKVGSAVVSLFNSIKLDTSIVIFGNDNAENVKNKIYFQNNFLNEVKKFDIIINTVPAKIIEDCDIKKFNSSTILFEIASVKCLNEKLINENTLKYVPCPSLPARFCPNSAATIMLKSMINMLKRNIKMKKVNIGLGITGSFCTFDKILKEIENLNNAGFNVIPILSFNAANLDTRYFKAQEFKEKLQEVAKNPIYTSIEQVEPLGPNNMIDVMVVAPCTGNTMSKIALAITDTPVTMAVKAHLRNNKPVVIAVSSNDALGLNFKNLGMLMAAKNMFFVPFEQDNFAKKPNSLIANYDYLVKTIECAMEGRQLQPILPIPENNQNEQTVHFITQNKEEGER